MTIIGLSGYARSGKDEFAKALVEERGFTRVSFADPMREALYALNPKVAFHNDGGYLETHYSLAPMVRALGWDWLKDHSSRRPGYPPHPQSVRALLQRFGTEVGREMFGQSFWVDLALSKLEPGKDYVFTDMRFLNEAHAIVLKAKGWTVRIERPGTKPANSHPSETELDRFKFDLRLSNSGTLEAFRSNALLTADAFSDRRP